MSMKVLSKLPASLSLPAGVASVFSPSGIAYDLAIGGIPFNRADSPERPFTRETAPFQREQVDQSPEAGENTLTGWWYRSQLSFHGGAGQLYGDPRRAETLADTKTSIRYFNSVGLDVWTSGSVTMLPRVQSVHTQQADASAGFVANSKDCALYTGTDKVVLAYDGSSVSATSASWGFTAPTTAATDGSNLYVANTTSIYKAPVADTAAGLTFTAIYNSGATPVVAWVKQRLVAGIGPVIYELTAAGPGLPAATYTHPNPSWVWTGITESTSAIYASGYAGATSAIFKFVLTSTGTMPTLSQGIVAALLPTGEVVHSIFGYLGTFLAIGTNKGVRVATVAENGDLTYGPLIVETATPVHSFAARDRFVWYSNGSGISGSSGTGRIDLGQEIESLRFAYANDVYDTTGAGPVKALNFLGSSALLTFSDSTKIWNQHPTELISAGFLQTSRVRYSSLEPKLYKLIRLRGPILDGSISISTISDQQVETSILNIPVGTQPGTTDSSITSPDSPLEWIALKFTLNRNGSDATIGAEMNGYQLKALPGTPRKRLINIPLLCFDIDSDRNRESSGYDGWAIQRLTELELIEDDGNTVLLQDFNSGESSQVTIERLRFMQVTPPERAQGYGGILMATVRTV